MVSESFRVYPIECLLNLSGHPLSDRYRTTQNMLSHAQTLSIGANQVYHITLTITITLSGCFLSKYGNVRGQERCIKLEKRDVKS